MECEYKIRHLAKTDLPVVMIIEDRWSTFTKEDIDFGKMTLKTDWAIDSFDIVEMTKTKSVLMVIEQKNKVVGFFAYEQIPLVVDLQHLSLEPNLTKEDTKSILKQIILFLKKQALKDNEAKLVVTYIRDRDEAHIRTLIPSFIEAGFAVTLARDHFDGDTDGWKCSYQTVKKGKPDNNVELTCP